MATFSIKAAVTAKAYEQGKALFREYAGSLNFDLGYQDFERELNEIARQYAQPEGALLLGLMDDENAVGCVGIRKFAEGIAELKRLYVQPDYRSLKMGKQLLQSAIDTAKQLGYAFIRLDTVPGQTKAQELYRYLGFYEIKPYGYSAVEGTVYFEKRLK